jgi:hypothetical protein
LSLIEQEFEYLLAALFYLRGGGVMDLLFIIGITADIITIISAIIGFSTYIYKHYKNHKNDHKK